MLKYGLVSYDDELDTRTRWEVWEAQDEKLHRAEGDGVR
ncbi:hypothetical protein BH20ACT13_BH20ACT13_17190 [soil metagenome]